MRKVLVDRELLPCPFCGQQDAFVEQLDSDASVVICQGMVDEHSACLARGPVGVQQSEMEDQPGRDAAIADWNRRAQPAEAEGAIQCPASKPAECYAAGTQVVHASLVHGIVRKADELQAALSAVTAEHDQLRADLAAETQKRWDGNEQSSREHREEIDQGQKETQ